LKPPEYTKMPTRRIPPKSKFSNIAVVPSLLPVKNDRNVLIEEEEWVINGADP
jgi:hypothetical protein